MKNCDKHKMLNKLTESTMIKKITFFSLFLLIASFTTHVEAFSFSKSGSGHLKPEGYYYFYIYQYVYINFKNEVCSESHTFSFHGALSDEEDAKLLGLSDDWLIYEGKKYLLAVPVKNGEKIYIQNKSVPGSPNGDTWIPISDPI